MKESFVMELFKAVFSEEIENEIRVYKNSIVVSLDKNNVIEGCVQKMFQVEK